MFMFMFVFVFMFMFMFMFSKNLVISHVSLCHYGNGLLQKCAPLLSLFAYINNKHYTHGPAGGRRGARRG